MPAFLLREAAGDGGETPILVRFVEVRKRNAECCKTSAQKLKRMLVTNRAMDIRGMVVGRATVQVSVLDRCVCSLHGLLREWDIAARDGIQIRLAGVLGLHDALTSSRSRLTRGAIGTGQCVGLKIPPSQLKASREQFQYTLFSPGCTSIYRGSADPFD